MSTEEQSQPVPPRTATDPQVPVPQTVSGVLNEYGAFSDTINITDIGPDYSWMAAIEEYLTMFTIKAASKGEILNFYPQCKFPGIVNPTLVDLNQTTWHWIPFGASKWWSGCIRLRFMAIKPPRIPCKILIRYTPDPSDVNFNRDMTRRGIKHEWDLALTQDCSIDIAGYNWTAARPTWIPRVAGHDAEVADDDATNWKSWVPHLAQVSFGAVQLEIAHPMIPGNIFPDDIRILVFQSFPRAEFYSATDIRSMKYHFFMLGPPWDYSNRTIAPD